METSKYRENGTSQNLESPYSTYLPTLSVAGQTPIQTQIPTQTLPILEVAGAKVIFPSLNNNLLVLGRSGPVPVPVPLFTHGG